MKLESVDEAGEIMTLAGSRVAPQAQVGQPPMNGNIYTLSLRCTIAAQQVATLDWFYLINGSLSLLEWCESVDQN